MKIEEVKNLLLKTFKENKNFRSILIDGKWGCGKTTVIKDCLNELNRKTIRKVYYQSCYGIKDVSELGICFKTNPVGRLILRGASPMMKYVPLVGKRIHKHLDYILNSGTEKIRIRRRSIFIFDDFERTHPEFSYTLLLGFFNQLLLRKCQIICVSSLCDLANMDVKRKEDLGFFVEKTFDRIIQINEDPYEIIRDIFKKENIIISDEAIERFDKNIRIANRTCVLIRTMLEKQKQFKYNIENDFNISQIVECGMAVIKGIYTNISFEDKKTGEFLSTDDLDEIVYKRIRGLINENIYFTNEEKFKMILLAKCMAIYETFDDFSKLNYYYPAEKIKVESDFLHTESFYLLDDEDKEKYILEFIEATRDNKLEFDRWYGDRLVELFQSDYGELDDDFIEFLTEKFAQENVIAFNRIKDFIYFGEIEYKKEIVKKFVDQVIERKNNNEIRKISNKIDETIKQNDYSYLNTLILDANNYKLTNKAHILHLINEKLEENDFYFPDFSKSLDYETWHYCHNVSSYCASNNLKEKALNSLKDKYEKYKLSKSAISKIKSIVTYRFGQDAFDSQFK